MKCTVREMLFSALALIAAPIAGGVDLYSTQPWHSGFAEAVSEADEAARPISDARARWEQMTDSERAEMLAQHNRAFVRGGVFRPDSETAAQAKQKREKKQAAQKKPAGAKKK